MPGAEEEPVYSFISPLVFTAFPGHFLGISCGPGPVLGAGDSTMFETDQVPTLIEFIVLAGKTDSKP